MLKQYGKGASQNQPATEEVAIPAEPVPAEHEVLDQSKPQQGSVPPPTTDSKNRSRRVTRTSKPTPVVSAPALAPEQSSCGDSEKDRSYEITLTGASGAAIARVMLPKGEIPLETVVIWDNEAERHVGTLKISPN